MGPWVAVGYTECSNGISISKLMYIFIQLGTFNSWVKYASMWSEMLNISLFSGDVKLNSVRLL